VRSRAPILLTGPTGAGKSHLARRMFELKKARHLVSGEFVEVNCATLRGDGAASTLFGHKKGAFTGAASDRAGLLRTAHEGVLFLDEIGELGLDEQAMLLKAVEEKRFLPVGSDRETASDFQLIAGTHRDLRVDVAEGRFREDLYARINLWAYTLPGLAQRPEDLEPNVEHLLARSAAETGRAVRFNAEAKAAYLRFAQSSEAQWSGNFRDLAASITRLATLAEGGRVTGALVDAELQRLRWSWRHAAGAAKSAPASGSGLETLLPAQRIEALDLFDRLQLEAVVGVCRQSRSLSEAGRKLFERSRTQRTVVNDADRLRKYLQKFGLNWDAIAG
jgi:transcriptional regulatory protein RtcR